MDFVSWGYNVYMYRTTFHHPIRLHVVMVIWIIRHGSRGKIGLSRRPTCVFKENGTDSLGLFWTSIWNCHTHTCMRTLKEKKTFYRTTFSLIIITKNKTQILNFWLRKLKIRTQVDINALLGLPAVKVLSSFRGNFFHKDLISRIKRFCLLKYLGWSIFARDLFHKCCLLAKLKRHEIKYFYSIIGLVKSQPLDGEWKCPR